MIRFGFFLGVNGLFRHPACLLSEKNKTAQIEEPFNLHRHDSDLESSRRSFRKMGTTIQARQSLHDLDALLLNHMEHGVMYCHCRPFPFLNFGHCTMFIFACQQAV
jgi:hypothetical protein